VLHITNGDRAAKVMKQAGRAKFQEIASAAKRDCPLSKALAGVAEIMLKATLR